MSAQIDQFSTDPPKHLESELLAQYVEMFRTYKAVNNGKLGKAIEETNRLNRRVKRLSGKVAALEKSLAYYRDKLQE